MCVRIRVCNRLIYKRVYGPITRNVEGQMHTDQHPWRRLNWQDRKSHRGPFESDFQLEKSRSKMANKKMCREKTVNVQAEMPNTDVVLFIYSTFCLSSVHIWPSWIFSSSILYGIDRCLYWGTTFIIKIFRIMCWTWLVIDVQNYVIGMFCNRRLPL